MKFAVGTDFDPCEQRLRIRRPNTRRLELGGSDLIVEQRRGDEVFQIVVGLLFGLWMVLRAEAPATRDIESPLEDVTAHVLDVRRSTNCCRRFRSSTASRTGWPWISEQYFFRTVCLTNSSDGSSQSTGIVWPNMRSSPSGLRTGRLGR